MHLDTLGVGLFTIPTMLERDFAGTMATLASIGYKEVETFGPYWWGAPSAQTRWDAITPHLAFKGSGYFGLTAPQVRKIFDDNGLTSPAMHVDLDSLRTHLEPMSEAAAILGQRYVILPSIPFEERQGLDAYRRMADEFNQIGRRADSLGMRFAYHNHGYGHSPVDGVVPFDLLVGLTDPSVVDLEMDIYWTAAGGVDPVKLLERYPNRYKALHIKDMSSPVRFAGDGGDSSQWIALFDYVVDAGDGVLDLPNIVATAKRLGVQHFLIERDQTPTPIETLQKSHQYLSALEFA